MMGPIRLSATMIAATVLVGCSSVPDDYIAAKAAEAVAREQKAQQQEQQLRRDADNAFRELDKE